MNRKGHTIAGAISGTGVYCADRLVRQKPIRPSQLIGAGVGGAIGGRIPDLLEPAKHSYHRSFFHGGSCATLIGTLGLKARDLSDKLDDMAQEITLKRCLSNNTLEKILLWIVAIVLAFLSGVIIGLFGGYLSHIVLDASTARSVPLIA